MSHLIVWLLNAELLALPCVTFMCGRRNRHGGAPRGGFRSYVCSQRGGRRLDRDLRRQGKSSVLQRTPRGKLGYSCMRSIHIHRDKWWTHGFFSSCCDHPVKSKAHTVCLMATTNQRSFPPLYFMFLIIRVASHVIYFSTQEPQIMCPSHAAHRNACISWLRRSSSFVAIRLP